jgi:ribosomal protein L32
MTACPSCGARVLPGETICGECGTELVLLPDPPAVAPPTPAPTPADSAPHALPPPCPDCGERVAPDLNGLCPVCGYDGQGGIHARAPAEPGAAPAEPVSAPAEPASAPPEVPLPGDRARARWRTQGDGAAPAGSVEGLRHGLALQVEGGQTVFFEGAMREIVPLEVDELLIGRRDPTRGHYPDLDLSHLAPLDPHISRRHARVLRRQGQWWVEDLCRNDATFLNDRAHVLNGEAAPLAAGDRVLISDAVALRVVGRPPGAA